MRILRKSGLILMLFMVSVLMLNAQEYTSSQLASKANGDGIALYEKGSYVEAAKKFDEAMKLFEKSEKEDGIEKTNEKSELLQRIVNSYAMAKDYSNLAVYMEKQLAASPNDLVLAKKLSQLYRKMLGDFDKGIKVLVDFDKKRNSLAARKLLAKIYFLEKDFDNAIVWYNKALEIKEDGLTMAKLAQALINTGQNDKAIVTLKNYIATNPKQRDKVRTYNALGKLYEDISDKKNAITYYQKALTLDYDSKYNQKLVNLYYESGNFQKTVESAKLLRKNAPKLDNYATYMVAISLYKMNDKSTAINEFKKIENDKKYGKDAKQFIKSISQEI